MAAKKNTKSPASKAPAKAGKSPAKPSKVAKPVKKTVKPVKKVPIKPAKPAKAKKPNKTARPVVQPAPKRAKPTKPVKDKNTDSKAAAPTGKRGRPPGSKSSTKKTEESAKPLKLVTKGSKTTKPVAEDTKVSVRAKASVAAAKAKEAETLVAKELPARLKTPYGAVFLKQQRARLLNLKDEMMDSMSGMTEDTIRSGSQDGSSSAFGMHQADAGSDSYDRDFALNLLSQEQDALYEIEEALKRIENHSYGVCEMSGKPIPQDRLEVRPYARFTVQCQEIADKEYSRTGQRFGVRSLFGLGEDEEDDDDDNDSLENEKE